MNLVIDASVVVAAYTDDGAQGAWARSLLTTNDLFAPDHLLVEVASSLRRLVLANELSLAAAEQVHEELLALPVELRGYPALAARAWELRNTVTAYDACYVALAEQMGVEMATIDGKLLRANGPRCSFKTLVKVP